MTSVTYDDRSFLVDGRRVWLSSGSVHYFRIPAALWSERLLAAKRAGLNCIDTYIAWNFHEPQEGKWDFSGDKDIAAFIRQAGKLGLYVILRPGPYICAEWDFGGLPSWLTTKSGIAYRTNNAIYMHYFDKYFRQVLPRLAELQVSRGGNIILIQNENEYQMTTMPDRLAYLEFINQLIRRAGFDVPIINCNWLTDPPAPDNVECANGYDGIIRELKRLRQRQPGAPMLATEFWSGCYDWYGGKHNTRDPREVARVAMEAVGCGAQLNYYMWCGGTNFGFWASHLNAGDGTYQTTSYDSDAPMAEAGGLTRKYYLNKLVCMLSNHMGRYLATCTMGPPGATIENASQVYNLTGPTGNWAIVSNGGREEIQSVELALSDGAKLNVPLHTFGAAAVPFNLKLLPDTTLEYTSLTPLGFFHDKTLVLHGPAGWKGLARVNGKNYTLAVPAEDDVTLVQAGSVLLVVINSELAMRTWWVEDTLVLGPSYVGATTENLQFDAKTKDYFLLGADAKLLKKKAPKPSQSKAAMPKPSAWKLLESCAEAHDGAMQWQKIDRPRDVDSLGVNHGYLWYRVEIESRKAAKRQIFLPECEDRATIFHNGKLLATWGRGPGATRTPIATGLVRGKNVLTILLDNMGRINYGPNIGELKGLYGHIYNAKPLKLGKPKIKKLDTFPRRVVPRKLSHLMGQLESRPVWQVMIDLPLSQVAPVHLSFTNLHRHMAVLCNERLVSFIPAADGGGYGDIQLGSELQKGKNKLELLVWGDFTPEEFDKLRFHLLDENLTQQANWSVRLWSLPEAPAAHPVKKRGPAWFTSHFKRPQSDQPVFLRLTGGGKGQLFLNRHNLGRYWSVGPQELYYLPSCWLADENRLTIFEETGTPPTKVAVEVHPAGPYR